MLEAAGLKTAILRAPPNKREGWVEKQVKAGVDVIITHPRKVETGIDLLDFPTIIWMAIDYSVYTVLQASRRSWRIGQTAGEGLLLLPTKRRSRKTPCTWWRPRWRPRCGSTATPSATTAWPTWMSWQPATWWLPWRKS
jgi:hypothetical protein